MNMFLYFWHKAKPFLIGMISLLDKSILISVSKKYVLEGQKRVA
jgi:hypothetical protein